jgi:type IV secretory pathway ATPase VirB11/archaellum biosynthesis ATPase
MFYLNKRLNTLVNRISHRVQVSAAPREIRLGFTVDFPDAMEDVESFGGAVPRAIARKGAEFEYIVGSGMGRITGTEAKSMEAAKASVIEELSRSSEELGIGAIARAKEIASRELLRSAGRERADYLAYLVAHDTAGYGPISALLEDRRSIEEIEVNSPRAPISVYHVKYGRCATNLRFCSEHAFRHSMNRLLYDTDKELSDDSPVIDAQVEDARIHAQLKPYALSGAVASIRLGSGKSVGPDYLINRNTTTFDVLAYVWLAMESGRNIIVAGAPASGKTTFLSALFFLMPRFEKVVTIEEDINELKARIDINNTVELYGSRYNGITTREQVINALRMRPSRLVIGEVRGEETKELFSSANLGIPFVTTMHSNSGGMDIVKKLMVRPMGVESRSLSMLDVALYMRHTDITRRLLSEVYEYRWLSRAETERIDAEVGDGEAVEISCVVLGGVLDRGVLQGSKVVEAFSRKTGLSVRLVLKEFEKRSAFLKEACGSCKSADDLRERVQSYGW